MQSCAAGHRVPLDAFSADAFPRHQFTELVVLFREKTAAGRQRDSLLPKRTKFLLQFRRAVNSFLPLFLGNDFCGAGVGPAFESGQSSSTS